MGFGAVLGGALSGIGQGMVKVGEQQAQQAADDRRSEAELRRQTALENLRAQNASKQSAQDAEQSRANGLALQDNAALHEDKQANRDHGFKLGEIGAQANASMRVAAASSALSRANTEAELRLRKQLGDGDIKDIQKGGDGYIYAFTAGGKWLNTGVAAIPEATVSVDATGTKTVTTPEAKPNKSPGPAIGVGDKLPAEPARKLLTPAEKAKRPPLTSFVK